MSVSRNLFNNTLPKTATTFRTQWYAEVTDLKTLCKAIGEGRASTEFVIGLDYAKDGKLTSPALNKQASSLKSTMKVDGVIAKSRTV